MTYRIPLPHLATLLFATMLVACTQAVPAPMDSALAATPAPAVERKAMEVATPKITVHRDAYCGCCHLWVEHLRKVVRWAREHGVVVASDECYAELDWREPTTAGGPASWRSTGSGDSPCASSSEVRKR